MDNLISRAKAIEAFEKFIHEIGIEDAPYNYGEIALCEANVPSAEKVGKWMVKKVCEDEYGIEKFQYFCSECDASAYEFFQPYCHRCGARMGVKK